MTAKYNNAINIIVFISLSYSPSSLKPFNVKEIKCDHKSL